MATDSKQLQANKSTQNSLLITEIKDGVVVLRDGSLRGVVMASAINFDLMNTSEQEAVEQAYQGFLNSLHFPVEIVIKSHRIDLDPYLEKLETLRNEQSNELLGMLMEDYIANVRGLVEEVHIMDKQFYVVVPYFPPLQVEKGPSLVRGLKAAFQPTPMISVSEKDFKDYKTELSQRIALVSNGLSQIGVRTLTLGTQELVDLYYACYNPEVAQSQKLIDASQIETPVVTKGDGAAPRNPLPGGRF